MDKVKRVVNLALAAVSLAMGVAVVVMTAINVDIATNELIKLLGIAVASLGILALSNVRREE